MNENIIQISDPILSVRDLTVSYDHVPAVKNVSVDFKKNSVTAIMGPSGCGKSTLLRAFNRMHELYENIQQTGNIFMSDIDIMKMPTIKVRRRMGMVFQRPNPFPTMSIYDNVISGYKLNGIRLKKSQKDEIVERSLRDVTLWDEVKDSLFKKGTFLSGGQQQRLCIARALAFNPEIILLDEPTSALDPISSKHIEELFVELKQDYAIILVTHTLRQALRIADHVIFMYLGEVIEAGPADEIFNNPKQELTRKYLEGAFS